MAEPTAPKPYVVFARRWRPQTFDDVVGQDHISQQLRNAVTSGRVGHAFLFRGPRGVGKTSMARILARALNCESGPAAEPCGTCSHCRSIAAGSAMDVIEIDAATHTQVDEMRNILASVGYSPSSMRFKIYIVDEVHMLSKHSFNALLKTLEEPPPAVKFIFATTDPQKIPDTIRSRCQDFEFRRISTEDIVARLDHILSREEGVEAEESERRAILEALAWHAEGGMRDAQVALDQLISLTSGKLTLAATRQLLGAIENRQLLDCVRAMQGGDTARLLELIDQLVESGADLENFVKSLMQFVRDLLILKTAPRQTGLTDLPSTWMEEVKAALPSLDLGLLLNLGHNLFTLAEQIKTASHIRFLVEFFFIKLTAAGSARSIDSLLRALESGAPPPPAAPSPPGGGGARGGGDPLASPAPAVAKVFKRVADPSDMTALWSSLLSELWSADHLLKTRMEQARPLSVDGNTLRIGFSDKFAFDRLKRHPANADRLRDLLSKMTGQPWDVRFVIVDSAAPPAASPAPEPVVEEARAAGLADPEEEHAPDEEAPPAPRRPVRPLDLLRRYPFLQHIYDQFQCTGIRLVRTP